MREHGTGIGDHTAEIEPGADRDEEQAEQQPLERLDRHLDLAAELGLGEQQAGDEGAERPWRSRPPRWRRPSR